MWSTIELREIRTFLVLSEELHFGRAAERLELTPSRVSQIVRTLETRVGGRLFDRTSRRVALTPLGEELLTRTSPIVEQLECALRETREVATGVAGTLRIGMYTPINGGPRMAEIIKTFESRHPGCRVILTDTGFGRDQLEWLRKDELDVLAMRLPIEDHEVTVGPILSSEERIVALATDHPLAERESVGLDDLADYAVADVRTLPRKMMDAFIPPRTPSGKRLRRIKIRTMGESIVRVALGETVHPTVGSLLDYSAHPGVTSVPINGMPASKTALVWLTARESVKVKAFARAAADVLERPPSASTRRPPPGSAPAAGH
jgi:DNA-binding transcriptional LysR family regulator